MLKKIYISRFYKNFCLLLASLLTLSFIFLSINAKAVPEINVIPDGMPGDAILKSTATATEDDHIFKVDMQVEFVSLQAQPLYLTIILDETASMYQVATKDPQYTVGGGSVYHPRWDLQMKQYNDLLTMLADPMRNPSYNDTYVSVLSYGSYSYARTADRTGVSLWDPLIDAKYTALSPTTWDISTKNANFSLSELYFIKDDMQLSAVGQLPGGFVKISDSLSKLRDAVPNYPYMSFDMAKGLWDEGFYSPAGAGWPFFGFLMYGSSMRSALSETYFLMEKTREPSNPDRDNARRVAIAFSDNLEDMMGPKAYLNIYVHQWAAALKAPTTVTIPNVEGSSKSGMDTEIWAIGTGFDYLDESGYPNGRADMNQYRLINFWDMSPSGGPTLSYGKLDHLSNWSSNYIPWANSLGTMTTDFPDAQYILQPDGENSMLFCDPVWEFCAPYMEPHLVSLSMDLEDPQDFSQFNFSESDNDNYHKILKFYAQHGKKNGNNVVANYDYVESVNDSVPMFNDLLSGSTGNVKANVLGSLAPEFEITNYLSYPMFTTTGGSFAGTAVPDGTGFKWTLNGMPPAGQSAKLTFYVKIRDTVNIDPARTYNIFGDIYIDYTLNATTSPTQVIKNFPELNVTLSKNGVSPTTSSNPLQSVSPGVSPDTSSGGALHTPLPNTGGSNGNTVELFPGTINTPTVIYDEQVQDGTEAIPLTGTTLFVALAVTGTIVAAAVVVNIAQKKKKR